MTKKPYKSKLLNAPASLDDVLFILDFVEKHGRVKVELTKYEDGISEAQRNYYFWVVVKICGDYYGYTTTEMHEELKRKYLPDYESLSEQIHQLGYTIDDLPAIFSHIAKAYDHLSITDEKVGSFERYLKRIREGEQLDSDLFIPLPNEEQQWKGWENVK